MTGIGAHSDRFSMSASGAADVKSAAMFDFILPVFLAAGYDVLRYPLDHAAALTPNVRFAVLQPPKLDINDSHPGAIVLTNVDSGGAAGASLRLKAINDIDLTDNNPGGWVTAGVVQASMQSWRNAAEAAPDDVEWSGLGHPDRVSVVATQSTDAFSIWKLVFTATDNYECFVVASAYGHHVAAITGTLDRSYAGIWSRATYDPERAGRKISVLGVPRQPTPGAQAWPIKLGNPQGGPFGAVHLVVRREGQRIGVLLPTGVDLYPHDISREVCSQSDLWVESQPEDIVQTKPEDAFGANQQDLNISIGIPEDSEPCGEISLSTPRIAIEWVDEELRATTDNTAKGLTFYVYRALGGVTVTTGVGNTSTGAGTLEENIFVDFRAFGVKVGAFLANKTKNGTAVVIGLHKTGSVPNILVLDNVPSGWANSDTYEVYRCADHNDGIHSIAGCNMGVVQNGDAPITPASGLVKVVLNDYNGEAAGKYEIGQNVTLFNNASAVVLKLTGVTGTLTPRIQPGDWVRTADGGNSDRSRGRVLMAQDTSGGAGTAWTLVVNTIRGAAGVASPNTYKRSPWFVTDGVVIQRGLHSDGTVDGDPVFTTSQSVTGTIGVLSTSESVVGKSTAWVTRLKILDIDQVDVAGGDVRHRLHFDFGAAGVGINPLLSLFPGFSIGARAKQQAGRWNQFSSGAAQAPNYVPQLEGQGGSAPFPKNTDQNVRQQKRSMASATWGITPNPDQPNWQHKSLSGARVSVAIQGNQISRDKVAQHPHLMTVTARGTYPAQYDILLDERSGVGASLRAIPWIALKISFDSLVGAAVTGTNWWWCIGPGRNLATLAALAALDPVVPPPVMPASYVVVTPPDQSYQHFDVIANAPNAVDP